MNNPAPNKLRRPLFIAGGILFLTLAVIFYFTGGRIVSTDNAYVQAAHVDISANIAGRVTQVFVKENQQVHQGDPLFALDNRDYLIAIQDANAKLANARLQTAALQATYTQRQADTQAAVATLRYQTRELDRQKILAGKGISSQEQLEMAQHAVDDATQKLNATRQEQNNIHALLGNAVTTDINAHPDVQQAQAVLERAQLNLSYTIIKAPMDGIVSKVDQLQPGKYINAATPVFSLISSKIIWIEANFKETQLTNMHPGQKVTIDVDAYPDHSFHGSVTSLSSGTGASFALLPPENATGNWVKVVQRLPVRISIDDLDPKRPLRSGLSAIVDVDTQHSRLQAL
ncbi:HlyD family secretion protein [Sulfuriferula nivalis]|nr:HlyD family secretion protein [Sulfuriferula nivalis]